jgi:hypothetical protein
MTTMLRRAGGVVQGIPLRRRAVITKSIADALQPVMRSATFATPAGAVEHHHGYGPARHTGEARR